MQRLLIQNGFYPTIMHNPNCLDGFDLDSMVTEVKLGMALTKKLLDDPNAKIFSYGTPKTDDLIAAYKPHYLYTATECNPIPTMEAVYTAEKKLYQVCQEITFPDVGVAISDAAVSTAAPLSNPLENSSDSVPSSVATLAASSDTQSGVYAISVPVSAVLTANAKDNSKESVSSSHDTAPAIDKSR